MHKWQRRWRPERSWCCRSWVRAESRRTPRRSTTWRNRFRKNWFVLLVAAIAVAGMRPDDPGLYGRLVLDRDGGLERIVEARDAGPAEGAIGLPWRRETRSGLLVSAP